jgi:hypothetical protein
MTSPPAESALANRGSGNANVGILRRPKTVGYAIALLWVSLGIAFWYALYQFATSTRAKTIASVVTEFVLLALAGWLFSLPIVGIRRGRNWARILMLVLVAGGCLVAGLEPDPVYFRSFAASVIWIAQAVLQVVAVSLTFTPSAAAWFKGAKS